jgi:DNA segregation ATPase FtsK/SpoIIIE-like protein
MRPRPGYRCLMAKYGRTRLATVVVAAVLAGIAIYMIVLVVAAASSGTIRSHAVPLLVLALLAGAAALFGWRRAQAAAGALLGAEADTRAALGAELARERADRERSEVRATRLEEERAAERAEAERRVTAERTRRAKTDAARRVEREWNRELRTQIVRMQRDGGALGNLDDIPALVLHIAITLLEAEKGLLLSQTDRDGDGELDLIASEGFEADPSDSAVAQRFAGEVIDRDRTIREDDADALPDERSPADREIDNLVAIPIYVQDEFSGVVVCANRDGGFHEHEDDVLLALGDHAGAILENGHLHGQLRGAYLSTVRVLAAAIEA